MDWRLAERFLVANQNTGNFRCDAVGVTGDEVFVMADTDGTISRRSGLF
jgi:hypothetical protein